MQSNNSENNEDFESEKVLGHPLHYMKRSFEILKHLSIMFSNEDCAWLNILLRPTGLVPTPIILSDIYNLCIGQGILRIWIASIYLIGNIQYLLATTIYSHNSF